MQLRPYQAELIDRARAALREHRRVCLVAPTGAGKTAITVHMMQRAAERERRSCFIVHQNELLMQTSRALWDQKLEHGMIAAGRARSGLPAQVASVQTLVNRLGQYDPFDLVIFDECHRSAAASYQKVLDAWPDAHVIGLTATPARTDGRGLAGTYDVIVEGPTIAQLIKAGYLSDYELYAPPVDVSLDGVRTTAGDYNAGDLEHVMARPTITGDAIAHYRRFAKGRRCVVMCTTVKHARDVAEQYCAAGIAAASIDGKMSHAQRDALLDDFRAGRVMVLTSVQLLVEGLDVPLIGATQWLRPTQSLIVWMQGNGRGLRPAPGKDRLIILDHVGNYQRHAMPDAPREWTLEGRPKGARRAAADPDAVNIQTCEKCYHVFMAGVAVCPGCGAAVEMRERVIKVVEGDLERIEREHAEQVARSRARVEQGRARTLEDLVAIGVRRGMKNPAAWAANVYAARDGRKAGRADYSRARAAAVVAAAVGAA